MPHADLAVLMQEFATLDTILGANVFQVRAYERASQTLETTPEDVEKLAKEGRIRELPGIGDGIAKKIEEFIKTGRIAALEELRKKVDPAILALIRIPGLGPKKAKMLVEELGIKSVDDLEKACREEKVRPLKGMGAKSEEKILAGIASMKVTRERVPLWEAREIAAKVVEHLRLSGGATMAVATGSVRRWKESVRDLDVATVAPDHAKLMKSAATMPGVVEVIAHGETKTSVYYGQDRFQVDVRVVPEESYGAALQYFTGSKEHSVRLREKAVKMGLTVNEYGVHKLKKNGEKGERIAGASEEEVYEALGFQWIPPELREDKGELDAFAKGKKAPRLIERADIKGDLHCHTTWSDGTASVEEMAKAAERRHYEYVAITDHSPSAGYAGGLNADKLKRQWDEIAAVQEKFHIKILRGSEVDILAEGKLDWPDKILEQMDFVVASIHQRGKDDREANTKRLVRALEHPCVKVIGHPSTRRLGLRPPLDIDWEAVYETAIKHGKALELNSSPERLDLDEIKVARASSLGIPIFIDTDAHSTGMFDNIEFGVMQARRAWLKPEQVVNTKTWKEMEKWLMAGRK
ncbi:MAG: DNA polymerase/3'-5' exonuclease PolX [Planctomycetota bacterium]